MDRSADELIAEIETQLAAIPNGSRQVGQTIADLVRTSRELYKKFDQIDFDWDKKTLQGEENGKH